MKRKIAWIIYGLFVTVCFLTTNQTADAKGHIRYNLSEDGVLSFYGRGELKRADYLLSIEKDCIKIYCVSFMCSSVNLFYCLPARYRCRGG